MPAIHLVANEVLFTSYGHLQLVFDADGTFGNGDEIELEVQAPFLASGDWDVRPVQPHEIPLGADSLTRELDIPLGLDIAGVWDLLVSTRDFFAAQSVDYRLGLTGSLEGQNSNTYITTLAHIVGLDIAPAVDVMLASAAFDSFPGLARNVLFDHHAADGTLLAPIALDLAGTGQADIMSGGNGADRLRSRGGNDTLNGFGDADDLGGGGGRDTLFGGSGDDMLTGNGGRDRLFGEAGNDTLQGGAHNDRLTGGAGRDTARGGDGHDILTGNGGRDSLSGGKGSDILNGGGGNDILTGGNGGDTFLFNGTRDEDRNEVTDFASGTDIIRITGLTFDDITISGETTASITLETGTEIVLTGVAAANLTADDFDFGFV